MPRLRIHSRRPRRGRDILIAFAIIVLLALIVARLQAINAERIETAMRVVDGDTIAAGERRIRLVGIDAPEHGQTCEIGERRFDCGEAAAAYLRGLIGGKPVSCRLDGTDRYGRALGFCRQGETELNREMVRAGQAVAYGGYEGEEAAARAEQAGLWAGIFDRPSAWREANQGLDETPHEGAGGLRAFLRHLLGI